MPPPRVSLIEDQPSQRSHFAALLPTLGLSIASTHPSAEDALRNMLVHEIDLALIDIVLPSTSGIELTRQLKQRRPGLPILMLTVYEDPDKIFNALAAGADGYLLKTEPPHALAAKIRETLSGGSALSASIARKIVQHFRRQEELSQELAGLTARELTVLREVAQGHTYKEVGNTLGISAETVRAHVRNIKGKLCVGTRGGAVAKLWRRG